MRTTVDIDDRLMRKARQYAATQGTTLTATIEQALRQLLAVRAMPRERFRIELLLNDSPLCPGVDIDDRDRLYDLLDDPRDNPSNAQSSHKPR